MKSSTMQPPTTVREQLNAFFTAVYIILDPLSDPLSLNELQDNESWKLDWKRIKKQGFAPDCNHTRYRFSFFLFGRDKAGYKPDRSVKNIIETYCRRFPIQEHFTIVWSEKDPDMFYYHPIEVDENTECSDNLVTQPDEINDQDSWTTVPGTYDPDKNQSPMRKPTNIAHTYSPVTNRFAELLEEDNEKQSSDGGISYSNTSNDTNLGPSIATSHTKKLISQSSNENIPIVPKVTRKVTKVLYPQLDKDICKEIEQAITDGRTNDIDEQLLAEWIMSQATTMVEKQVQQINDIKSAVNSGL